MQEFFTWLRLFNCKVSCIMSRNEADDRVFRDTYLVDDILDAS